MRRNDNISNNNRRTILTVVCAILIVLFLLILPWFCFSGTTNNVPSQPISIKPETGHVEPAIPVSPCAQSTLNNHAVQEEPDAPRESGQIYHPEPTATTTPNLQENPEPPNIESTTPTPTNPDLAKSTSPTVAVSQEVPTATSSIAPSPKVPSSQDLLEPTSANPRTLAPEAPKEGNNNNDNQTSLKNPRVIPRDIPVNPTHKPDAVSQEGQPISPTPSNINVDSGESGLMLWVIIFVILLICYIIARVKLKRGNLVITANFFDKILIIVSPILFFVAWCIGFDHELSPFQIILLVLSGLMLVGSILFSIFTNLGNVFHIIISILAKIFIFIFTNFLLLLLVVLVVFSFVRAVTSHNDTEGTYVMKYDHFLDQWVGYRID